MILGVKVASAISLVSVEILRVSRDANFLLSYSFMRDKVTSTKLLAEIDRDLSHNAKSSEILTALFECVILFLFSDTKFGVVSSLLSPRRLLNVVTVLL